LLEGTKANISLRRGKRGGQSGKDTTASEKETESVSGMDNPKYLYPLKDREGNDDLRRTDAGFLGIACSA